MPALYAGTERTNREYSPHPAAEDSTRSSPLAGLDKGPSNLLMRLRVDVEVVGPHPLRARMAQSLSETLERYARQRPPGASGLRRTDSVSA